MQGVIILFVGFAIGWLVFERPAFVTKWFDALKAKVGF